jgi:molybdopterin-guanine dinucleotide biosynthesis protein MobB
MVRIIAFVGHSNSGKTTLIEKLITELRQRNYAVGAVKSSSVACEVDREGKDSYRLRERGADPLLLITKTDIALFAKNNGDNPGSLIERFFSDKDFVLIEGGKNWKHVRKIEVVGEGKERLAFSEQPIAVVSNSALDEDIPQFRMDEVEAICNLLEQTWKSK